MISLWSFLVVRHSSIISFSSSGVAGVCPENVLVLSLNTLTNAVAVLVEQIQVRNWVLELGASNMPPMINLWVGELLFHFSNPSVKGLLYRREFVNVLGHWELV